MRRIIFSDTDDFLQELKVGLENMDDERYVRADIFRDKGKNKFCVLASFRVWDMIHMLEVDCGPLEGGHREVSGEGKALSVLSKIRKFAEEVGIPTRKGILL